MDIFERNQLDTLLRQKLPLSKKNRCHFWCILHLRHELEPKLEQFKKNFVLLWEQRSVPLSLANRHTIFFDPAYHYYFLNRMTYLMLPKG